MTNREKYYYPKIYKLLCPITKDVKYIGTTKRYLSERLWRHCNPTTRDKSEKVCWIAELRKSNLKPIIELIEIPEKDKEIERESYWISIYGRENLLNMNDGDNKPPDMAGWNRIVLSDDIINQLGVMPDKKLSVIAGVSKYKIQRERNKLNIESYASRTGNNGQFQKKGG